MKTVTMYEAKDGKQFRHQAECLEYEQQCDDLAAANDMLEAGIQALRAESRRPSAPVGRCWELERPLR